MIVAETRDVVRIVKPWLAAELAAVGAAPFDAATVSLTVPTDWELGVTPPLVVLFDDSGPDNYPVMTRPTVRVTVWATDRDDARAVAARCQAMLRGRRIPGVKVVSSTGLIETADSKLGAVLVSFTVSTRVRTVIL